MNEHKTVDKPLDVPDFWLEPSKVWADWLIGENRWAWTSRGGVVEGVTAWSNLEAYEARRHLYPDDKVSDLRVVTIPDLLQYAQSAKIPGVVVWASPFGSSEFIPC